MSFFNKTTKRFNTLKTAINNGLFSNPENFNFSEIINTNTRRAISLATANRLIKENKATPTDFILPSNFIAGNRIYTNTPTNVEKVKRESKVIKHIITEADLIQPHFVHHNIVKKLGITGKVKVIFNKTLDITGEPIQITKFFNLDERKLSTVMPYETDNSFSEQDIGTGSVIIEKLSNDQIQRKYKKQTFKDAPNNYHCVLDPILNYFERMNETKYKRKYLERTKQTKLIYSNGIPEDKMQEVCEYLNLSINIYDVLNNKTLNFYVKNSVVFNYVNQRYNHLEFMNSYKLDTKNATFLDKLHLQEKYHELIELGENPLYQTDMEQNLTCIYSANGQYALYNEVKEACKEFDKSIGIEKLKLITKDLNLFNFIHAGCRTTTHQSFHNFINFTPTNQNDDIIGTYSCIYDESELKEYDLKKAYTQFKENPFYIGFPSLITDFREINQVMSYNWIESHPGYFFIDNLNFDLVNSNTLKFFKSLGIESGIYSTPELLLFLKNGITFKIVYGAWSIKSFDFEFTEEMKSSGFYKRWTGMLNMFNTTIKYKQKRIKQQDAYISNLLLNYPNEIEVYNDEIIFSKPINQLKTFGHIGGFITSYTRTFMINELIQHDFNDILALKLDSFVCKNNVKPISHLFIEKPVKVLNKSGFPFLSKSPIYIHQYDTIQKPNNTFTDQFDAQHILCLGQGGCGKTHSVLTNNTNILYTAVPWRLVVEKVKEYNVKGVSFASLIGKTVEEDKDGRPYLFDTNINPSGHVPANVVIDEITMIGQKDKSKVYELYPYSRIFFIGDLSTDYKPFQTTFGEYSCTFNECKQITYTDDRRSKCDKLKELKLILRRFRESDASELEQTRQIYKYISTNFKINNIEYVKQLYNVNDWILTSTKNGKNSRTAMINSMIDAEKYKVVSHNKQDVFKRLNDIEAYLNGDYIIGQKPNLPVSRYEKTNASTIHSIQGLTVKNSKIFIDLFNLFDVNLIYTAISRAEYLNQIYFFI